jgi:dihydropteroate synthase
MRPLVMGVLNVTPDSFAESTHSLDPVAAVDAALRMEADGADIVDVGGESTRPGGAPVGVEEELSRVLPAIRALAGRLRVPISVDTYKADVAQAALDAGAAIVNDVSGLRFDPALGSVVADARAALILMHSRGTPERLHSAPAYDALVDEVVNELRLALRVAADAGVPPDRTIVDPGIGFAKRPVHSYGVLAHLGEIASALQRPLLAGPSRKSFMCDALEGRAAPDRDWGTAAAVTGAVLGGAHIVRVHAVAEMVQVVRVAEEIRRHG